MEQVLNRLRKREEYLLNLKEEKESALENSPEGSLCIRGSEEQPQYYHRKVAKDMNGSYMGQKIFPPFNN